ncbi:MAG TPA: putative metal-dependent hydrolase [Candidatus Hydrogenedentes bacterium]|nr:putative metal-dependent hydrolase [Candidatus Hydrogenedentota bacterium]
MSDPRFPIGEFTSPGALPLDIVAQHVEVIAAAPAEFRVATAGLSPEALDTRYRAGGWTVRQVVHHVADSHMNSYIRYKLALTEENPTIKPYAEDRWAELIDGRTADIEISLRLIEDIHTRWVMVLRAMTPEDWARTFNHPERGKVRLDETAAMYAWHCKHHLAHITVLRAQQGW